MGFGRIVPLGLQAILFVLINALIVADDAAGKKTPFEIRFEKASYSGFDNAPFTARIVIDPDHEKKLFSYGVLVQIEGTNGLVGAGTITPVLEFNYNGPFGPPALAGEAIGATGVKGTSDFFSNDLPKLKNKVFASLSLEALPAGEYTLSLLPYRTLGVGEQLFVQDDFSVIDDQITFGSANLRIAETAGTIEVIGALTLDPKSGLLTQTVRLTNTLTRTPAGIRIWIDNIPQHIAVLNAYGYIDGRPYIDFLQALLPGQSVDVSIWFFPRDHKTIPAPTYSIEEINPPVIPPLNNANGQIQPHIKLRNGYSFLEFSTKRGVTYYIQYSADLQIWKTAQPVVTGTGAKAQWIDEGPPRTESKPYQDAIRYYRIIPSK
jgi:hypothetical protein